MDYLTNRSASKKRRPSVRAEFPEARFGTDVKNFSNKTKTETDMKKLIILTIAAALSATLSIGAQPTQRRGAEAKKVSAEKMIENKVQRMQKQLLLDDKQAEKFASIYKEYLTAQQKLRTEGVKENRESGKALTDKQIVERQKQRIANQKKAAELKEEYYNKMSKVLNARQLEKVFFGKNNNRRIYGKSGMRPAGRLSQRGNGAPVQGKGNARRNHGKKTDVQICPAPADTAGVLNRPSL